MVELVVLVVGVSLVWSAGCVGLGYVTAEFCRRP